MDDLIRELEEARTAALTADSVQSAAAVSATMGKAKLLGMLVENVRATVQHRELPASVDDFV